MQVGGSRPDLERKERSFREKKVILFNITKISSQIFSQVRYLDIEWAVEQKQ